MIYRMLILASYYLCFLFWKLGNTGKDMTG